MILNIFVLAGIVLAMCVVGGLGFAGYRIMSRKMWRKEETAEMIVLGLGKSTGGKSKPLNSGLLDVKLPGR